jgi:RNA polymerase sigma factor (TIGR02999 family)
VDQSGSHLGPVEPGEAPGPSSGRPADHSGDLSGAVYSQLRAIAQNQMNAERRGHTLTATALVHEAYLRLAGSRSVAATQRAAFVHAAAEAMRRILIEHARARGRVKRGGGVGKVSLEAIGDVADLAAADEERGGEGIVAFDRAFRRLEEHDRRFADVVRLRFYAGLTVAEAAEVLGVSDRTVDNDWAYARAWLARELEQDHAEE